MSDVPPPIPPDPSVPPVAPVDASSTPAAEVSAAGRSPWGRYRTLPMWAQILIPVAIIAILIGLVALFTSGDGDESSPADTTVVGDSSMDDVLRGIIILGGIRGEATPATTAAETTAPATSEPTVSEAPDTTVAATAPEPTVTAAPTTTEATSTTESTESTVAATTEPSPTTTSAETGGLPSPDDFLAQWNSAAEGSDVPAITRDQISEIVDGPFAGAFLATLAPDIDDPPAPQVGLIGTMSTADPTQIAELLLVYVEGPDEAASDFYWDAFRVLTLAVDPTTTDEQIADLEQALGREDGLPPFPDDTDNSAVSNGFTYNLSTGTTEDDTPVTGIAVT